MIEREFFNELLAIFCQLRDLHTNFILPEPFRSSYAFLPFRLERCVTASGEEAHIVTRVMSPELWGEPIDPSFFQKGVIVKDWNGTPVDRVVAANADQGGRQQPRSTAFQRALVRSRFDGSAYRFLQTKTGLTLAILPNATRKRDQFGSTGRFFSAGAARPG